MLTLLPLAVVVAGGGAVIILLAAAAAAAVAGPKSVYRYRVSHPARQARSSILVPAARLGLHRLVTREMVGILG
jgi:hypothetical protein